MKLDLKRSVGKLEQYNIRIPAPLKQRLDATRKRAERLGVDFVGTLTATLDEFDVALTARLNSEPQSRSETATESVAKPLRANGADPDRA
jgi:hypothetical protein